MSFPTYLNEFNIKLKTGKTPSDLETLAEEIGFTKNGQIKDGIKATGITNWLKEEFELGHGHAMAIYAYI